MGKNLLLWLIIAAVLLTVFNNFSVRPQPQEITYSSFISEVQQDQVHEVAINGLVIIGKRKSGEDFKVVRPPIDDPKLMDELINHNVNVIGEAPEQQSIWAQLLIASFPILIIIAVFMLFMRQMQGGAGGRGGPMAFGKSKARLLSEDQIKTTFADVAGVDEAKEDVQELVDFLRDPGKFQKLGGRIPRGISDGRSAGYRQDAAGEGDRRRSEGAVLHDLRFRLRRDVRRRRRLARARHVRAGEEAVAVHHLHRRDRRGRSASRRGSRRRSRRARTNA